MVLAAVEKSAFKGTASSWHAPQSEIGNAERTAAEALVGIADAENRASMDCAYSKVVTARNAVLTVAVETAETVRTGRSARRRGSAALPNAQTRNAEMMAVAGNVENADVAKYAATSANACSSPAATSSADLMGVTVRVGRAKRGRFAQPQGSAVLRSVEAWNAGTTGAEDNVVLAHAVSYALTVSVSSSPAMTVTVVPMDAEENAVNAH